MTLAEPGILTDGERDADARRHLHRVHHRLRRQGGDHAAARMAAERHGRAHAGERAAARRRGGQGGRVRHPARHLQRLRRGAAQGPGLLRDPELLRHLHDHRRIGPRAVPGQLQAPARVLDGESALLHRARGVAAHALRGARRRIVHIANQAFEKITMFFVAGAIQRKTGKTMVHEFAGIGYRMPWTMARVHRRRAGLHRRAAVRRLRHEVVPVARRARGAEARGSCSCSC